MNMKTVNNIVISEKEKQIHKGHRKRMFDKVMQGGAPFLTDVELLEMLLYFVIKRSNTNPTAHALLDKFGSLKGVCEADYLQLCSLEGIGSTSAVFFVLLGELQRRIITSDVKPEKRFSSVEQIGEFFINKYKGLSEEAVMLLMLDNKNAIIDCKTVHTGTVSSSSVSPRTIAKIALDANAVSVVIAHNHPLGDPSPSDDDIVLTRTLRRVLGDLDINFIEHILVASDRYMPLISYMARASEIDYLS